jgi:hypothetical protein
MTYEEMEKSLLAFSRLAERDGREWRERMGHLEKSIQELRDAQLVHIHLMDRREKEWHEQFAPLLGVVGSHENEIVALRDVVRSHEDGIAELRGAMSQFFQRMDRFIQGLERENGHKQ